MDELTGITESLGTGRKEHVNLSGGGGGGEGGREERSGRGGGGGSMFLIFCKQFPKLWSTFQTSGYHRQLLAREEKENVPERMAPSESWEEFRAWRNVIFQAVSLAARVSLIIVLKLCRCHFSHLHDPNSIKEHSGSEPVCWPPSSPQPQLSPNVYSHTPRWKC